MIVASKNSKKNLFHYNTCIYAANIKSENIIYFHNKEDARNNGYVHCPYCSRLIKYYETDKETIDKFLEDHKLKMYIEDDSMYIENTFSAWKIIIESAHYGLELFHANSEYYGSLEKRDGHIIHHYHKQKYIGKKDIISILKYIVEHDNWRNNNINSYKNLPSHTKRQKKEYKKAKKIAERTEIRNLYNLIEKIGLELKDKK